MQRGLFSRRQRSHQATTIVTPGFNFTIILRAAFTRADPKSAKRQSTQAVFGALESASVKAACKYVDEIDTRSH